jgi:hypothetical protein
MERLADWIEYGRDREHESNKRMVRRWLREARGHVPIIARWGRGRMF